MTPIPNNLYGHSGCKLEILETVSGIYVRKISKDKNYNLRLQQQTEKQKLNRFVNFYTPEITNSGYIEDLFFFEMPYIRGKVLKEYVKTCELHNIKKLIFPITECIISEKFDNSAASIILTKILELEKLEYTFDLTPVFKILKSFTWNYVCSGQCHGDLTFENIIISNKQLFLIDFLDSFYDSWMIDIAKTFQDLECLWCYRNETLDTNTKIRLCIIRQLLIDHILLQADGKQLLITIYHLLLLHLVRILPYSSCKKDLQFLEKTINQLTTKIQCQF